jgi:hypothetical protein
MTHLAPARFREESVTPVNENAGTAAKWNSISGMWGGLGVFLFLFGWIVGLPLYDEYTDTQLKHDKIVACEHATDVTACVQAVTK